MYDSFSDGDMPRHAMGSGGVIYDNHTQRNTIERVEVFHDAENVTFTVRTKKPVTPPLGAGSWMKIYLNTDGEEGYDYVLNHTTCRKGKTTVARVVGKGDDLTARDIPDLEVYYTLEENTFTLTVPRAAIGIADGPFTLWFKVADSTEAYAAVEDFYDKGDAAPLGRLNFVYRGV